MAGIIMASEVKPNSYLNNEGSDETSDIKDEHSEISGAHCESETARESRDLHQSIENERFEAVSVNSNINSGLSTMDSEVTQKLRQETPVSSSHQAGDEFVECVKNHSSGSENEKFGSPRTMDSGTCPERREQHAIVVERDTKTKESERNEVDFLEDMKIFEANAIATGQPKGPMEWILHQIAQDTNPRYIISQLMPGAFVPNHIDDITLWKGIWELITEPKARKKLVTVNTLEDVIGLIERSKKIIVLTGAGVSVSCGIPDFRSRDGVYARLSKDFPNLPDPQSMFDIHYFRRDQRPFFKFAKEIYPGQFKPSLSHRFIATLDKKKKLLRNYTQNIDTLEQVAGIQRVVQCHGSFATASCTKCKHQVEAEVIRQDIFNQVVPKCPICPQDDSTLAVMKPDIIFFGEGLPDAFYQNLDTDKREADLLIVIGSSLKVRPVALIPDYLKPDVPQILINREPLHHFNFDVELLGNCDAIIHELCRRLGDDWLDVIEQYKMPSLDKEAIEKMLSPRSDGESGKSEDEAEPTADKPENSSTDQKGDSFPSSDSVPIDIRHIACDNTIDKGEELISECTDLDEKEICDGAKSGVVLNEKSTVATTIQQNQDSSETQKINIINNQSHDAIENDSQSHNSTGSQSISPSNIGSQPIVVTETSSISCCDPLTAQSHGTLGPQSNDASSTQSCNAISNQSHDPVGDLHGVESSNAKNITRKRMIDRVCKICAECEKRKVHERLDFSSEARLAQNNSNDLCMCVEENKRRRVESPNGLGSNDVNRKSSSSSSPLDSTSSERRISIERIKENSKPEIQDHSPSFDKISVFERFSHENVYYLYVPPNRYIFHGAELNTSARFQRGRYLSSSDDEDDDETNPVEAKESRLEERDKQSVD